MPTPKTHYRIALGERQGRHSWVIHSAKGIVWHNIPNDLATLLQKLGIHELLDVALGGDGRWYIRYRQKGPERHEMSPSLWKDIAQGSNVKLDRLTLGPGANHWGVHSTPDGVFQSFTSPNNRDRFGRLLESKADISKSSSQIDFVSLGYGGGWAFSVNGTAEYRCGKPFENRLKEGWEARKKVATVVLSPLARLWIIVWQDGTLTHNLPSNIATEVEDYCQPHHSLKQNSKKRRSGQPKAQEGRQFRTNQPETNSSAGRQQSTASSTKNANQRPTKNSASIQQPATSLAPTQLPTTSIRFVTPVHTTPASPAWPWGRQYVNGFSGTTSLWDRGLASSSVETVSAQPYVYVPPAKPSTTTLRCLDPSHWPDLVNYRKIAHLFENGWKHQYKQLPNIRRIFAVSLPDYLNKSYDEYKELLASQNGLSGVNEQLVFHGTTRSCSLGDEKEFINLCQKTTCGLCCILRASFLASKAGSSGRGFNRFGSGIYTTSVSSKYDFKGYRFQGRLLIVVFQNRADDYANEQWSAENKVVILATAALGKSRIYYETTEELTAPPLGYDSVLGEVGVDLNFDEQVLYRNDAIRPAYIVIYARRRPPVLSVDDLYD